MNLDHNKLLRKFPNIYAELIKHPSMNLDLAAESYLYQYGVSVILETFRGKYRYYVDVREGSRLRIEPYGSKRSYAFPEEAREKGILSVFETIEDQLSFI